MNDRFRELLRRLGEIHDLEKAAGLLSWDEETKMPPAGADARAEQRATLNRIAHELQVGPELGGLLEELRTFEGAHDYDSFEASLIRVARRDYEKASRIPPDLRAELTRAGSLGYRAWLHAREQEDYAIMLPHLEHNLELRREYIRCFDDHGDPYDVLLDDYEPGMKTADVEVIFAQLKAALVPMLRAVADAPPVDDSCLRGRFPRDAQRRFSVSVLERWGMDRAAWRLDRTVHPFAMSMSSSDIRLTTNFQEDSPHGILSCLHEFGHGVYERQIDARYDRTPLGHGVSAALHESQSRLWENLVGRSLATWKFFYPQLQQSFPEQFAGVPLERFHRALNKVQASLRRVDADEVTYCLHIILRFELERDILYGNVELRDLPEAFDAKMREYLGLEPPDVSHGVLQDVHWSDMGLGYFPTYALGNVLSLQIWAKVREALPDLDDQLEAGEPIELSNWLRDNLYSLGRKFTPRVTLERVTGSSEIDPQPYLAYLREKIASLRA